MSHGIRIEDIAWQAFQAARNPLTYSGTDSEDTPDERIREAFGIWWKKRTDQGCALPACEKCGYDPSAKVVASWTFVIERDVPSMNDHIFNIGPNKWKYSRERDQWGWELLYWRTQYKITAAGDHRRRVTLTRLFGGRQREFDTDNLVGGLKPFVDAMVLQGLLQDDSSASAELYYAQERGDARGLRVLLEEIE